MTIDEAIVIGDFSRCSIPDKIQHLKNLCKKMGLDYETEPFSYYEVGGKSKPYITKGGVEQLAVKHNISIEVTHIGLDETKTIYSVSAKATTPDGRTNSAVGAVSVEGLKGKNLANAYMTAETKAKRRVTLAICGVGISDSPVNEDDISEIPQIRKLPNSIFNPNGPITQNQLINLANKIKEAEFGNDENGKKMGKSFVTYLAELDNLDDVKHLTQGQAQLVLNKLNSNKLSDLTKEWLLQISKKNNPGTESEFKPVSESEPEFEPNTGVDKIETR